jgi:putative nucleotidyltransferase with HDIG domain
MSDKLAPEHHELAKQLEERGYAALAQVLASDSLTLATVRQLSTAAAREAARQSPLSERLIDLLVRALASIEVDEDFVERANVLLDCARYYQGIGKHPVARSLSKQLLIQAEGARNAPLQRRIHNALGAFCLDSAHFQECLEHLQTAIEIAVTLDDDMSLSACLANAMSALKELGHYHDAISAARLVMQLESNSANAKFLKFQCAGNGLFCAHRLQDPALAIKFLEVGNDLLLSAELDVVSKATYEYYRASYLVDTFDHETAHDLIAAAIRNLSPDKNPRVAVLLRISEALCEWATRDESGYASGRKKLRELYEVTKKSRLYHDDVLRALMKVHGNAMDNETAKLGIRYAKELVEYTTSVKRAKFYRQLSDRGVELEPAPPKLEVPFDPFANVRQWLAPAVADTSPEGKPVDAIHGPEEHGKKRQVAKHEELAAIHDDLAKLRTDALLKEIRSVAYDTAENWALAAEFFDDQTGQHCFRVGHLAGMLAREIGMENAYCARIEHAARLHDIGKIGVNEMILLKPGPLDPSELTAMRAHAEVGAYMLQGAKDPVLQMAAVIAKHHHEWWNGAGYPASLADRGIPLAARICALADVYDALTHARPYKGAWPHRVAVEEMLNLSGVQFDPHLIRPFLRVLERYVPALAEGRIPGLAQLRTNGLIASRKKLMETISSSQV